MQAQKVKIQLLTKSLMSALLSVLWSYQ